MYIQTCVDDDDVLITYLCVIFYKHTRICMYTCISHIDNQSSCTIQYLLINHLSSSFTVRLLKLVIACPVLIRKHTNLCVESIDSHLCQPKSYSSRHKPSIGVFRPSLISFFHKASRPLFSDQTPSSVVTHFVRFSINSQFFSFSQSVQYAQRIIIPHINCRLCASNKIVCPSPYKTTVDIYSPNARHARIQIHTCMHMLICTCTSTRTNMHIHKCAHSYIPVHVCTYTHEVATISRLLKK